jgi:small-conductance mechanosensitive channel
MMKVITEYLNTIVSFSKVLPWTLAELLLGWLAIKFLIFLLRRALRLAKVPADVRGLLLSVTRFGLWVVLIITVFQTLGLGSLAVAISGSAAVVAFFLSASVGPLLSNIFAGIFLTSDPDIKVGMKVTTNDGKTTGTIKGIDMRKVRIEDDKGLLHVVPNSLVEGTEWIILERK